jgi:hypothetical protein
MARTRKQPYRKSRRFDKTCRCHGACSWCRSNRLHSNRRRIAAAIAQRAELLPLGSE